jgi:sugar phosphate isomerase/epimerase
VILKRIIAVNSNTYHGFSLKDAISGIKAAGFNYIELTATKGWTEHVFPTMSLNELYEVEEQLIEAGLTPISLSGHTNLMDNNRLDDFIANIRLAHFFGCKYIISSIGEAHLEDQAELSDQKTAENIKTLIPYLEDYGLILGLENHGKHGTGKPDLKSALDKVGHLHLKDKAGAQKEWNFPALGRGNIDFEPLFKLLKESENNSPFREDGPADLAEVNQAVKESYQFLKEAGFKL